MNSEHMPWMMKMTRIKKRRRKGNAERTRIREDDNSPAERHARKEWKRQMDGDSGSGRLTAVH